MIEEVMERWAGEPLIRTHHRRSAQADPVALWDAARSVTLSEARTLGRLVRWRIPGTPADLTFHELFRRYPFTLLEEGETWSLSGLCGRIWTFQRDYPRLSGAADFEAWAEPGTARVLMAHWARSAGDGRAELVSEARVLPVDARATLRLRALWPAIRPFERLIGAEPLTIATRRAEA